MIAHALLHLARESFSENSNAFTAGGLGIRGFAISNADPLQINHDCLWAETPLTASTDSKLESTIG